MHEVTPGAMHPAGFWIRFVAFLLDGLVIAAAQFLLELVAALRWGPETASSAQGSVGFFTSVFAVAYPAVLHSVTGQTLGKMVLGIRVVAVDGELLPFGAALLRSVAAWLGLFVTLGIGHVIGGLRKDKRALHDLIAGTRVERLPRQARRAPAPRRTTYTPAAPAPVAPPPPPPLPIAVLPAGPPPGDAGRRSPFTRPG